MARFSALGKLFSLVSMVVVFFLGMIGVIYLSLQGSEITVPEITGKNFSDSEHELALLGLKIKKRADRVSDQPPNTVIEQLPKPGETVKSGQLILVVTSKAPAEGDEVPQVLKDLGDQDDTEKIEEMITDKPKKSKSNSNVNKKVADSSRDNEDDATNSNSSGKSDNSNRREPGGSNTGGDRGNRGDGGTPVMRPNPPAGNSRQTSPERPREVNRP